ncbi:MAG TPA: hypothetical protein VLY24_05370 [Bryobacteraceae bacterium]|nr:hypothetical protein [Bryobacteraceae bacterium]
MKFHPFGMPVLRLAYTTQFLIALFTVFEVWSQVGGQSHLDLMPWYLKLALAAGASFAIVRATISAVSHEKPWNVRTVRWLVVLLILLALCGVSSYYVHLYGEEPDDEDQSAAALCRTDGRLLPSVALDFASRQATKTDGLSYRSLLS